ATAPPGQQAGDHRQLQRDEHRDAPGREGAGCARLQAAAPGSCTMGVGAGDGTANRTAVDAAQRLLVARERSTSSARRTILTRGRPCGSPLVFSCSSIACHPSQVTASGARSA
ncbi:MAG: hypothetical protein JWR30_2990, partial [Conexibacter sp.]|nr:hypothetical protein [Conexibacter sp.]